MSMRELKDKEGESLEGDEEKVEALAGRHFRWEEGGRPLEEKEEEREGPGYSVQELVEKLRKALQGTSNTSAPRPDRISYRFIKAFIGTIFGEELLVQMAKQLEIGRAPSEWQLSKVVMIPKPGKDHTQLKGWRPINLINCVCKLGEKVVADELVIARAFVPRRPSTPILDLTRRTSSILGSCPATDFALEPSLWQPRSPSLVRVRVDLYITRREAILLFLALWILSRYL